MTYVGLSSTRRITARVSDDVNAKLDQWAPRLGVTKSQLAGMAIMAGIGSILRAVSPEDAISPTVWAQIMRAMRDLDPDMVKSLEGKHGQS